MDKFSENHPEFIGFSDHYAANIYPFLEAAENKRKSSLLKATLACVGAFLLSMLGAFLFHKYFNYELLKSLALGVIISIGGMFWISQRILRRIKSETKGHLVGGICDFIGWHFSERVTINPDLERWTENGLLPKKYHRVKLEDQMRGDAHGTSFLAMEAHLEKEVRNGNSKSWVTVFQGTLMFIEFKKKFLGKTVVRRNNILHNKKKFADMKKVGLVDPTFEKIFQAYGTDQVEARYLLTPDFMQKLVDLEKSVEGKRIRFAFIDRSLMIAVETKNRFEAGSMLKPLTSTSRAQTVLNEIGAVYDLIDGVMKPQTKSA